MSEYLPPPHKRRYIEAGLSVDAPDESSPRKRRNPKGEDTVPKLSLTRAAVRRLGKRLSSPRFPSTPQHVHITHNSKELCQQLNLDPEEVLNSARQGGPDLTDLRGYPARAEVNFVLNMPSSKRSGSRRTKSTAPTSSSSKTSKSTAYDRNFELHLVDNAIYPPGYRYPEGRKKPEPIDLEEIRDYLARPRASLSPSCFTEAKCCNFQEKNDRAVDEGEVMRKVIPIIAGESNIHNQENLKFTEFAPIAGDTTSPAKPDFYDGVPLETIERTVRDDLYPFIIPTAHLRAPAAPNFFMEVKGPNGTADVMKRQACYDGALGARGMHGLQSYAENRPVYNDRALSFVATYHAGTGTQQFYTTHLTRGEDDFSPQYHFTQVDSWALTGGRNEKCRDGIRAFRNFREYAQAQCINLVAAANEKTQPTVAQSSGTKQTTYSDFLASLGGSEENASREEELGPHNLVEPVDISLSSTVNSAMNNHYSDITNTGCDTESETSADELACGSTSNKRQRGRPKEALSHSRGKSGGGRQPRRK